MTLHFQKTGHGPPVVLLHGLLGSLDNLLPVARSLTGQFTVYSVDLRNHGQSHHHEEFNYPVMVEDLFRFCERHGLAHVRLLGHSMGGKTAMHFALAHPERVRQLVIVDMSPRGHAAQHDILLDALLALDLTRVRTRREAEAALSQSIPDLTLRRFLLKNLRHDQIEGFRWKANLRSIRDNCAHLNTAVPGGRQYRGPTLFIRGGKSDYLTPEDEPGLRELFPCSEVRTITAAGHWVHADAPEEFAAVLAEFFSRPKS